LTSTKELKTKHSIYNINYHIVFCPKYRHSISKNTLEQELKNVFQMICFNYGYELLEMEIMLDH
jgi:putative transposase